MTKPLSDETYSESETIRRRESALKRMLKTPPKPHTTLKAKKMPSRGKLTSRKRG